MRNLFLWGACLFIFVVTPVGPVVAQTCEPAPVGVTGWWPGDVDGTEISNTDSHATLQNGAEAGIDGQVNGAFQFDGVNDIADTGITLPPQGTLELWVKPSALTGTHGIIGTFGILNGDDRLWVVAAGPGGGPGVGPNEMVINLGSCCTNDIRLPSPLVVGNWTHLALTFDYLADSYILYVNGTMAVSSTASRSTPTQTLSIGGVTSTFGQAFYFPGLIDEVTLYSRVLDAAEIQAVFNAGSAGKCKDGYPPTVPVAMAGTSLDGNNMLQLDGTQSFDLDGDSLAYRWQIEGEAASRVGPVVSVADLPVGTYSVTLTVDDGTTTVTDTMMFGVPAGAGEVPTASEPVLVQVQACKDMVAAFPDESFDGPNGNAKANRRTSMLNMLDKIADALNADDDQAAVDQLRDMAAKSDSFGPPASTPDWVIGNDAQDLYVEVENVITDILAGCGTCM